MEDEFGVAYQQTSDEKDLEYAFFGIFDGHGGREAALFAKEHLMDFIVRQKGFWADDDDLVLKAIHEGFIQTHYAMWKELEKWPKTASGLPSTAGTTASIAFIRRGKIYVGHVGDSAIVLGYQDQDNPDIWRAEPLTREHKPESLEESQRITQCGGKVICKSGVPRVVWNRPKMGHKGPVRRSTHIDEIPFLAVARSLGDLWSYNSEENVFVVSPEPDIRVYPVDITRHRCLVLATDGCWNMLTPQNAISTVCAAEKTNEQHMLAPVEGRTCWINPSKQLVDCAVDRWVGSKLRADNTSVVTVMLDPPGPPRAQVLKTRKRELAALNSGRELPVPGVSGSVALVTNTTLEPRQHLPVPEDGAGRDNRPLQPPAVSSPVSPVVSAASESVPTLHSELQCNEISSSEDTPAVPTVPTVATPEEPSSPPPPPETLPCSQPRPRPRSLARELNALRLESPETPSRVSTRSQTSTTPSRLTPRLAAKRRSLVHKKKVVAKTSSSVQNCQTEKSEEVMVGLGDGEVEERLSGDAGSDSSVSTPRQLRARTPASVSNSTKRKRAGSPMRDIIVTRKSPRVISLSQPKVIHSKQAKVLKLKKH